jgi:hypothetical protein
MLLLFLTLGLLPPLGFYLLAEYRQLVPLPVLSKEWEKRRLSTKSRRPNH